MDGGPDLLFKPKVKPHLNSWFKTKGGEGGGVRVEEILGIGLVNTYLEVNDRCLTSLRS